VALGQRFALLVLLSLGLPFFGTSAIAQSISQQAPQDRTAAMKNPICVLPIGQTIDVKDLPGDLSEPKNWMGEIDSRKLVTQISIPATHDAGTALGTFGWSRCQVFTIPAQLALGIRGFDIRLRLVNDVLSIYHGEESQRLKFEPILEAFRKFLSVHPSEFLVMRVREESSAIRSTQTFEAAFETAVNSCGFRRMFFHSKGRTDLPSVRSLRGKVLILDNYGKLPNAVDYPNPTMVVQDDYDQSDMEQKYEEIISNFTASVLSTNKSVWYVNYTSSCNLQVDQLLNAVRINPRVEAYLRDRKGHLGLVFMNFPGIDVIQEIISSNF